MWKLALLVLNDPSHLDELLEAWEQAGVRGATIIESTGLAQRRGYLRDDTPIFPSMGDLLRGDRAHNLTLFAILDEQVEGEALLASTEAVIGDLAQPNTGIFVIMPLSFGKGMHKVYDPS